MDCFVAYAPRNDGREDVRRSIRFLGVRLFAVPYKIEAVLDLAEQQRKIPALPCRETRQYFLLLAQQARDQFLVDRCALARQAQAKLTAVVRVLDALDHLS